MNDKLKLLLDKINMNSEYYSYFYGGCIKKIIRNKELKKSCFVLELTSTLPVEVYDILKKVLLLLSVIVLQILFYLKLNTRILIMIIWLIILNIFLMI